MFGGVTYVNRKGFRVVIELLLPKKLSQREKEVLSYIVAGATRAEIAVALSISQDTVKVHTRNIVSKFHAVNVRDAFGRMVDYNRYYGIGGIGVSRFTAQITVVTEILPGRRDKICTRTETCVSMVPEWDGFKRIFYPYSTDRELSYHSDGSTQITVEHLGEKESKSVHKITFTPPVVEGDVLTFTEIIRYRGCYDPQGDHDIVVWSVPFDQRKMIYIFPQDDPPTEITYKTFCSNEETSTSHIFETRSPTRLELDVYSFQPGTRLDVHWRYD